MTGRIYFKQLHDIKKENKDCRDDRLYFFMLFRCCEPQDKITRREKCLKNVILYVKKVVKTFSKRITVKVEAGQVK